MEKQNQLSYQAYKTRRRIERTIDEYNIFMDPFVDEDVCFANLDVIDMDRQETGVSVFCDDTPFTWDAEKSVRTMQPLTDWAKLANCEHPLTSVPYVNLNGGYNHE